MKLLITTMLLTLSTTQAQATTTRVLAVGSSMDCLVQGECPGDDYQQQKRVVAKIDPIGNIEFTGNYTEIPKSVTLGDEDGVTIVSCSGGCTMSLGETRGSISVCDSDGFCVEISGSFRVKKMQEISN